MFLESGAIIIRRLHQRRVFPPDQLELPAWFGFTIFIHMAVSIMILFNALGAFGIHIMSGLPLDSSEKNILGLVAIVVVIKELAVLVVLMSDEPVTMQNPAGWRFAADAGLVAFITLGWSSVWQAMLGMARGITVVDMGDPASVGFAFLFLPVILLMFYVIYFPLRLGVLLEDAMTMRNPIQKKMIIASYILAGASAAFSMMSFQ